MNPQILDKIQSYISVKKTFHVDAFDMEKITEIVYGKSIEMLESPNDTTHQVSGVKKEELDEYDISTLEKAIKDGCLENYNYRIMLTDLCNKDYLEPGDYFLRMSW
jgi:hypothetical protein